VIVATQVGLKGESLGLHTVTGSSSVEWGGPGNKQPLTWHKVGAKNQLAATIMHLCNIRALIFLLLGISDGNSLW
jgi:hypothetical protein